MLFYYLNNTNIEVTAVRNRNAVRESLHTQKRAWETLHYGEVHHNTRMFSWS